MMILKNLDVSRDDAADLVGTEEGAPIRVQMGNDIQGDDEENDDDWVQEAIP